MELIELGDKAKDEISGFSGIVTARTEWLKGCVRFCLTPDACDKEGKPKEGQWFDDVQVKRIGAKKVGAASRPAGGPKPAPVRSPDPES